MHQSKKVCLKDRRWRSVCYSAKVNITRTKMLGQSRAIKKVSLISDISVTILRLTGAIKTERKMGQIGAGHL